MTSGPYTLNNVPPDTDTYIYRFVTHFEGDPGAGVPAVTSRLTQIWISQP